MAIINRLSRLFRADLHAVLDQIEEPDVMLKQALREMEESLHNDEKQLKHLQNSLLEYDSKSRDTEKTLEQFEHELDICFESDEHDLARRHIKRKLELQRYQHHLLKNSNLISSSISELKERVNQNKSRYESMQQKLDILLDDRDSSRKEEFTPAKEMIIHDDEVEVAFLREKQLRGVS